MLAAGPRRPGGNGFACVHHRFGKGDFNTLPVRGNQALNGEKKKMVSIAIENHMVHCLWILSFFPLHTKLYVSPLHGKCAYLAFYNATTIKKRCQHFFAFMI
ncbi:hypothetical protein B4113_0171 [Geobacillus sp. B4113_201601]|nr:hypothetical protein B4113_0171 [Geobacillus sp. B4113_201601]